MGRRGRKAEIYQAMGEPTGAREELERRWRSRMVIDRSLARLVTAAESVHEPFHRWLPFRQGFSPELVRRFLQETCIEVTKDEVEPILDPFSGTGTVVVECARNGIRAIGVEASPVLAFLTKAKFEQAFPAWPTMPPSEDWEDVAPNVIHPAHRAALLLAVARQYTTQGRPNRGAAPLAPLLENMIGLMRDDFRRPLCVVNLVEEGDARDLDQIRDESIGAILTSPPYLSRHDYSEITAPLMKLYGSWVPEGIEGVGATPQLHATLPSADFRKVNGMFDERIDALPEIWSALASAGFRKLADGTRVYFSEMGQVLAACLRVLRKGSPLWMVIGGARPKGIYVASDLITAEIAQISGFVVESIVVARDLIHARRKLGGAGHLSPRESVLILRKPSSASSLHRR